MKFHLPRLPRFTFRPSALSLCVALAGFAALVSPTILPAQLSDSQANKDAAESQAARAKWLLGQGAQVHYKSPWSLDDLPHYKPERQVSGTIREWGSNYFSDSPLSSYWETAFQKFQPGVKFQDHLKTSEHAISALIFNVSDIGPMGRQITWDERLAFQREFDYQPLGIVVVTGSYDVPGWNPAIGIFVNKNNPISKLTLKQLDGIFGAPRSGEWNALTWDKKLARGPNGNIRTWGQLGLTGKWADKPIHVLGYNLEFHFPEEITTRAFGGVTDKWNENLVEYANAKNPDGTTEAAGKLMMQDVSKDPYAICYVAGGTVWQTPQTKALPLAWKDGGPYYDLTMANVRSRKYPLYADVFFFVNRNPKQPLDPKVKEYLRFILSREGQEQVVRDGKYLPLTGDVVREQLKKLE